MIPQQTAALALLAGLTWGWGHDGGTYRPDDRPLSTVQVPAASPVAPAMRIVPAHWERRAPEWVFPFAQPAAPEEDDNQALAVNTTDGSETYSVEFALVWAEGGDPVHTKNEAYALASCTGCAAVAVGFQVVLIEEPAEVIAPGNHSAAVNYECTECLTHALANQLVLSVDDSQCTDWVERLSELWDEIDAYGRDLEDGGNLQNIPLSEIQSRLDAYREQIIAIVQPGPGAAEDGDGTAPTTLAPTQPA